MKCKGIAQTVLNGIAAIEERASERRITLNDDEMRTAFLTLAGIWSRAKYYDYSLRAYPSFNKIACTTPTMQAILLLYALKLLNCKITP